MEFAYSEPITPTLHYSITPIAFTDHEPSQATIGKIFFVDTTLRDGQLSLWASNMRTGMMLPIAERLDQAGFEAIEMMSSAFYKKCVRDLKDDPWERIRLLAQRIKKTPLRSIRSRSMLAFQITPPAITDLWLERLAANGISELRTSDPSNTPTYWREAVAGAKRVGLKTILNIIYSISPKHTDEYFRPNAAAKPPSSMSRGSASKIRAACSRRSDPRAGAVDPREAKGKPVEFHTHCNTGLGAHLLPRGDQARHHFDQHGDPAARRGFLQSVAFQRRHERPGAGLSHQRSTKRLLNPVTRHFTAVAKQENLPIGRPLEYDAFHPLHQVPGGMISNFRFQLANLGKLDQLPAVLEEVTRVRAEFGYPIMVTPYSQFFGVQAAINVMVGERYKEVTDEVLLYALGLLGRRGSAVHRRQSQRSLGEQAARQGIGKGQNPRHWLGRISQ